MLRNRTNSTSNLQRLLPLGWGVSALAIAVLVASAPLSLREYVSESTPTHGHRVGETEDGDPGMVAEIEGDLVTTVAADDKEREQRHVVYQIISTRGKTVIMAKVNTRFCRPSEDSKSLVYAPVVLPPKKGAPSDEDYLAANWYYNYVQPPEAPEGKMVASVAYYIDGDEVVAEYTYEDAPPPIRTFSKLKLYAALTQAGLWDALVAWLQNQTVEGMNAYTAFTLAQDLSDAHPLFQSWYAKIKHDLGISDEVGEEILEASLAE